MRPHDHIKENQSILWANKTEIEAASFYVRLLKHLVTINKIGVNISTWYWRVFAGNCLSKCVLWCLEASKQGVKNRFTMTLEKRGRFVFMANLMTLGKLISIPVSRTVWPLNCKSKSESKFWLWKAIQFCFSFLSRAPKRVCLLAYCVFHSHRYGCIADVSG